MTLDELAATAARYAKNVFIDTSIYRRKKFGFFNSPYFYPLRRLTFNGKVSVFTTEITREEIKSNIHEELTGAISHASILKNLPQFVDALSISNDDLNAALVNRFEQFEGYLRCRSVPLTTDVGWVMTQYFDRKPPFGSDKKKCEFPDAFVVRSLHEWCVREDKEMYVVSGDVGMRDSCQPPLYPLGDLGDFYKLVSEGDHADAVREVLKHNRSKLRGLVVTSFAADGDFQLWEHGLNLGNAELVEVHDVHGVLGDEVLINSGHNWGIFDIPVEFRFVATVRYHILRPAPDPPTHDTVEIPQTVSIPVQVFLEFAQDKVEFGIMTYNDDKPIVIAPPERR